MFRTTMNLKRQQVSTRYCGIHSERPRGHRVLTTNALSACYTVREFGREIVFVIDNSGPSLAIYSQRPNHNFTKLPRAMPMKVTIGRDTKQRDSACEEENLYFL